MLLNLHSAVRYIAVILLFASLFTAYKGLVTNGRYSPGIRKLHFSTRFILNIQMMIGIALYILKGYQHTWANLDKLDGRAGFFAIGHVMAMFIAIVLVNIGYQNAMKKANDKSRYKQISIFYSLGTLLIFLMIPWPFLHDWATWF